MVSVAQPVRYELVRSTESIHSSLFGQCVSTVPQQLLECMCDIYTMTRHMDVQMCACFGTT